MMVLFLECSCSIPYFPLLFTAVASFSKHFYKLYHSLPHLLESWAFPSSETWRCWKFTWMPRCFYCLPQFTCFFSIYISFFLLSFYTFLLRQLVPISRNVAPALARSKHLLDLAAKHTPHSISRTVNHTTTDFNTSRPYASRDSSYGKKKSHRHRG